MPGNQAAPLRDLLESAFDSLPCGVVVFDRRFRMLLRNRLARHLLPNHETVVEALASLSLESRMEDWPAELTRVLESSQPRRLDIARAATRDLPELFLSIALNPLPPDDAGLAPGGVLVLEDVSDRISMERRLGVSERLAAVGKLAARVAHELNNPLDGILRYANLALRRLAQVGDGAADGVNEDKVQLCPADGREDRCTAGRSALGPARTNQELIRYLEGVRSGILRMEEILSTLLEFSRSTPSALEQATLNKIVEDAVEVMEGRADESNVTVVCRLNAPDIALARGSSLFQVFCNLIKNAIDAMGDGGTLTITTRRADADVVITFEDTGVGLPPDIDKIFEPFYTTKEPGKGTGLGLAVCRELIEKYAGTITAQRRRPRGSTFIVTLPIDNCAVSAPAGRPRTGTEQPEQEVDTHRPAGRCGAKPEGEA